MYTRKKIGSYFMLPQWRKEKEKEKEKKRKEKEKRREEEKKRKERKCGRSPLSVGQRRKLGGWARAA
jgi:hypothetical protein